MGSRNKATIEGEIQAAREIDRARESGEVLAKDVLNKLMKIAEGATGLHKPSVDVDEKGKPVKGDWTMFGTWFDRTAFVAKELAKYQSPTFKAIAVQNVPALPEAPTGPGGKLLELPRDAVSGSRIYQRIVNGK